MGISQGCSYKKRSSGSENPERRPGNLYLWERNLFQTGDRSCRTGNRKSDFVLQILPCKKMSDVLSALVSENRILCGACECRWNYQRKLEKERRRNWCGYRRTLQNRETIFTDAGEMTVTAVLLFRFSSREARCGQVRFCFCPDGQQPGGCHFQVGQTDPLWEGSQAVQ